MENITTSLNKSDLERLDGILSMRKTPEDEASYLFNLYGIESLHIARDCAQIFYEVGCNKSAAYWNKVYDCLKPRIVRH